MLDGFFGGKKPADEENFEQKVDQMQHDSLRLQSQQQSQHVVMSQNQKIQYEEQRFSQSNIKQQKRIEIKEQ